jgi:hypothetical protein
MKNRGKGVALPLRQYNTMQTCGHSVLQEVCGILALYPLYRLGSQHFTGELTLTPIQNSQAPEYRMSLLRTKLITVK